MAIELKKLNAQIASIGKKTAKWRDDVQLCLVGCAFHAFEHGNLDPMTKLVNVLTGADAAALIKWAETHMPAIWLKKEVRFRMNKSFVGEYDAVALMADAWWELAKKPRNISSTLDCLEAVRALIKRIESEVAAGTKTIEHAEVLASLKAVAGSVAQSEYVVTELA